MNYKERVVRGEAVSEHSVQLFDTLPSRAGAVARFVADGLAAGDTVLVVAQPQHWTAIVQEVEKRGCSENAALQSGQLTYLNAANVLQQFLVDGLPNQDGFDHVVGALVRRLAAKGRPLRAYGEMVDLLAAERNFAGALSLEECWNALAGEVPFALFCGYTSAHFAAQKSATALELVCRCHSAVKIDPADELGSWLLSSENRTAPATSL
jgi:hypothetical protein